MLWPSRKGWSAPIQVTMEDALVYPPNSHSPSFFFFMRRPPTPTPDSEIAGSPFLQPSTEPRREMWFSPASGTQGEVGWGSSEKYFPLWLNTYKEKPPLHFCLRSYHVRSWGLELCPYLVTRRGHQPDITELPNSSSLELPGSGFLVMGDDYESELFKPLLIRSQACNQRDLKKCYFLQLLFKKAG